MNPPKVILKTSTREMDVPFPHVETLFFVLYFKVIRLSMR